MAGALRRTMIYLGLAETDDDYTSEATGRPREVTQVPASGSTAATG